MQRCQSGLLSSPIDAVLWDRDDDAHGNVEHCAAHGISKEEVEEVFLNPTGVDVSATSGRPVIFGDTRSGRHLMVVYDVLDGTTAYPVTAYDVPRRIRQ
jgi:uncharacterized DUF497 family protein